VHQEALIDGLDKKLKTWGFPVRANMPQQIVNSIANSLPTSKKLEKSWTTVSIHSEPVIMIQISGLRESPIKCRLEKLCKATIQVCIETDIQRETIKRRKMGARRYCLRPEGSIRRVG
jgi:hypothetical protein